MTYLGIRVFTTDTPLTIDHNDRMLDLQMHTEVMRSPNWAHSPWYSKALTKVLAGLASFKPRNLDEELSTYPEYAKYLDNGGLTIGDVVELQEGSTFTYFLVNGNAFHKRRCVNVPPMYEVGQGATLAVGSDRYPYFITRISPSGKHIEIQRADYKAAEGSDYFMNQKWDITPSPDGGKETIRMHKDGYWYTAGGNMVFPGYADRYEDPHI